MVPGAVPRGLADDRAVAVILDTSGSMQGNDPARYTVLLSQILSDLLSDGDELTVIGMLDRGGCRHGPSSRIARRLDPLKRQDFKQELDGTLLYNTGTHFAASVRTAIAALDRHRDRPRLLLVIADSGGLGSCQAVLTGELMSLHDRGAMIAAVNLGSSSGAFDRNPAFDFTLPALSSTALVEAVGQVYQRFLGGRQVQTGEVSGAIRVDIAPYAREAFLVVAADGPVRAIRSEAGNPAAGSVDLDHRGGGSTRGLDGMTRGYRIVHLDRPEAGSWSFRIPDLVARGGWLLIQDLSSLVVTVDASAPWLTGQDNPMTARIVDRSTGKTVEDCHRLGTIDAIVEIQGEAVPLTVGDDCLLRGIVRPRTPGRTEITSLFRTELAETRHVTEVEVKTVAWRPRITSPQRVKAGEPAVLSVRMEAVGTGSPGASPREVEVVGAGESMTLRDNGQAGDEVAGDGIFSTRWIPRTVGRLEMEYRPRGGDAAVSARAPLEVLGHLGFGDVPPVRLGPASSGTTAEGGIDLSAADVRGSYEVEVTTDLDLSRSVLELDAGTGWQRLGREPVTVPLAEGGLRTWALRLRVAGCPDESSFDTPRRILLRSQGPDGPVELPVPLAVEVREQPWLVCWWPVLATAVGLALAAVLIHGFWAPSRFPRRLAVVFSSEEDMSQGVPYLIRRQKGSGSGFYRDARIFVRPDFRLSGRAHGALARLRAQGQKVLLQPQSASSVERRNVDDTWEPVPNEETVTRFGSLYRNDRKTLYFELRNG